MLNKLILCLCTSRLATAVSSVRTIYQFASNDTWLENIVVRSNGIILTTEIGPPASLLAFDPRQETSTKQTLWTTDLVLGISGITEAEHDVFYITGSNTTSDNIGDPPKNSTHVWRVDFTQNSTLPDVTLVATPTAATYYNGLAAFNKSIILASASDQNSVFATNVDTGYSWEAMIDDDMTDINGLKIHDGYLYWTSRAGFVRARLHANITIAASELITSASPLDDFAVAPNSFAINGTSAGRRYAYAATAGDNSILQIEFSTNGTLIDSVTIAGSEDSTEIAEPTSAAFGRGQGFLNKLYVTTGGGSGIAVVVDGVDTVVGAQLLELQLQ